jgi:hypothetical protein
LIRAVEPRRKRPYRSDAKVLVPYGYLLPMSHSQGFRSPCRPPAVDQPRHDPLRKAIEPPCEELAGGPLVSEPHLVTDLTQHLMEFLSVDRLTGGEAVPMPLAEEVSPAMLPEVNGGPHQHPSPRGVEPRHFGAASNAFLPRAASG